MWARSRLTCSLCLLLGCACLFLSGGCHSNTSRDLLEAELRTREDDLREAKDELNRAQCENQALMREVSAVRQGGPAKLTPEQAAQTYRLKQIALGRGTGGLDNDDCPGDEALQIIVEPKDCDGHTIKAPGMLHVEALEISPEGIKAPISAWDVPPDQLRRSWRSGFLSTGYSLVLPWRSWPSNEKVRVVARFIVSDGRVFEAEKDVTIHLTPVNRRKPLPGVDPGIIAVPDSSESLKALPPPRKLEQGSSISKSWWRAPPSASVPAPPADLWHPKAQPSLLDSVQVLQPAPLRDGP
ncbi:MAG TPA: hypothetical protein VG099_00745 [Gemmataceae bacterium]|jgi:hypothetical protein|nr:hypothetical protein [Gemmataceae bacterium]